MTLKELKLMAANIVRESNSSSQSKFQLLKFIANEASSSQLKSFILDGEINILDDETSPIVESRFDNLLNQSIIESIEETQEFLFFARESICDYMGTIYKGEKLENIINFVMTEATDYQVLSMLVESDFPKEDSNPEKEVKLIESINKISGLGLICLNEDKSTAVRKPDGGWEVTGNPAKYVVKTSRKLEKEDALKNIEKSTPLAMNYQVKNINNQIQSLQKQMASTVNPQQKKYFSDKLGILNAQKKKLNSMIPFNAKTKIYAPAKHAIKQASNTAKKAGETIKTATTKVVDKGKGILPQKQNHTPYPYVSDNPANVTNPAKYMKPNASASIMDKTKGAIKNMSPKTMKTIGGVGLGALAGYGAYKAYKAYKGNSAEKQVAALRNSMAMCNQSDNPSACKATINAKIAKLQK